MEGVVPMPTEEDLVWALLEAMRPVDLASLCRALAIRLSSCGNREGLLEAVLEELKTGGSPLFHLSVLLPSWRMLASQVRWQGVHPFPPVLWTFLDRPHPVIERVPDRNAQRQPRPPVALKQKRKQRPDRPNQQKKPPAPKKPRVPSPPPVPAMLVTSTTQPPKPLGVRPVRRKDPVGSHLVAKKELKQVEENDAEVAPSSLQMLREIFPHHSPLFIGQVMKECRGDVDMATDILTTTEPEQGRLLLKEQQGQQSSLTVNEDDLEPVLLPFDPGELSAFPFPK